MATSAFGRWTLLGAVLVVAGCAQGAGPLNTRPGGTDTAARAAGGEVEAPEIFAVDADGLWDGRPSLGGVWIAHPSVSDPQRVRILNKNNGRTITGALFRRERDMPGPPFQVSSDAAQQLQLLAGQPTPLKVVAMKRAEQPPEAESPAPAEPAAPPPAAAATEVPATPGGETPEALSADAVAAIGTAAEPVPEDAKPSSFGRGRPRPAAGAAGAEPQPVPEDRPPTSFGRRQPREAAPAAGTGGEITMVPLDAAAVPQAADAPAMPAAPAVQRPYVQAAIFGTEANADTAAAALRDAGMQAEVRKTAGNGTTYWRVLIGPAATAAEQAALLEKTRGLGYPDAYPVRG